MKLDLDITAGLPYSRQLRVVGAVSAWPTLQHFEVRSHVRAYENSGSALRSDLTPFLSRSIDGNDILVMLTMNGKETRALKSGFYDIVISDVGDSDSRAIVLLSGKVNLTRLVTEVFNG